jgi:hypothetical protein
LPSSELGCGSPFDRYLKPFWLRYFGVSGQELEQLVLGIAEALDGRRQSWGTMLKPAASLGHLCFAPSTGQNVRFTRPDSWAPNLSPVDSAAALPEITLRYLTAYGPATLEDFRPWFGIASGSSEGVDRSLARRYRRGGCGRDRGLDADPRYFRREER